MRLARAMMRRWMVYAVTTALLQLFGLGLAAYRGDVTGAICLAVSLATMTAAGAYAVTHLQE